MQRVLEWLKTSFSHLWEALLKNLGTAIGAFIVSGGYLIAINKLHEFQQIVRRIPTDYVLTPLVLLLVLVGALWHINRQQRRQLVQIQQQQPEVGGQPSRFVTHLGVWWKIYQESEYIEDFPYCRCCEARKKLVQIEWHPVEAFKCPTTGTEVKLYDGIPRKRDDVLQSLYQTYFHGIGIAEELRREFGRLKELDPSVDDMELVRRLFSVDPFNRIPKAELDPIFARFKTPQDVFYFFRRYHRSYRHFFQRGTGRGR